MRRRNHVRSFFACAVLEVYGVFFAAALSVAEDKPIRANTFFFNQVVDNCVHPIPAELLSSLAGFTIPDNCDLTVGVIAELLGYAGEQGLVILAESYRAAFEVDAGQIADTAIVTAGFQAERIDIVAEIFTALRIRAFAYT